MKAYLISTGSVFALITAAHIWRLVVEGPRLLRDPWLIGITLLAVVLCAWAIVLLRRLPATR